MRISFAALAAILPVAAQITVTPQRIAGAPSSTWQSGDNGPAINALMSPSALTWDHAGNLLIADNLNRSVRKLTAEGRISKAFDFATYGLGAVAELRLDNQSNFYVVDQAAPNTVAPWRLSKITPDGHVSAVPGFASLSYIPGMAIDNTGNVFVAQNDPGYVWKVTPDGQATKVAGTGSSTPFDGQAGAALSVGLGGVHSLAFDRSGNLLMATFAWLLRLNADGTIVPLQGAGFPSPYQFGGIAVSADNSVFIVSFSQILRVTASGALSVYAGIDPPGAPLGDLGDGCAASGGLRVAKYASLHPADLAVDPDGKVYIADFPGRIRRIDTDGSILTVAGTGNQPLESASGGQAADVVLFENPAAIAGDAYGNIVFAEPHANRVREILSGGILVTIAGNDSPPPGEDPACFPPQGNDVLSNPSSIALDADGNVYIADTGNHRILRVTTLGGPISARYIAAANVGNPTSVAIDSAGQIYFTDVSSASSTLRRVRPDGAAETVASPSGVTGVFSDSQGRLFLNASTGLYRQLSDGSFALVGDRFGAAYAADPNGALYGLNWRLSSACHYDAISGIGQYPTALGSDPTGNLYYSSSGSIWQIPPIPLGTIDTPSPALDDPGIFNAASNLAATKVVTPAGCGFLCKPDQVTLNDSIAPNEILRIRGACLGPLDPSTGLSLTRVLFDGVPAPLLRAQSGEILAVAPQSIAGKSQVEMTVLNAGVQASVTVPAAAAAPGLFGAGKYAAAINADGSINAFDHPASAGTIVSLFLTGAGLTDPQTPDGSPAVSAAALVLPVTVQVGGLAAEVTYAGAAPGLLGIAQVNARIPTGAPATSLVQVTVGGISRNQNLSIVVKP